MAAPSLAALRRCLAALTDAFDRRGPHDVIHLDRAALAVQVDSRLEDVDARPQPIGPAVSPPDGLFEWGIRRDFVRSLPAGALKRRLGETLGGPRTRRRFEILLDSARDVEMRLAFVRFRRRRLRRQAARVLREAQSG